MTSALTTILLVAAIAVCIAGVWAALRLAAAADSVRRLSDDLETQLPPLLEKADVTVDALNAELLRLDMIVTQVEDVSDRVSSASSAVHAIVNAPYEVVNELGLKLRRSLKSGRKHREPHEPQPHEAEPQEREPLAADPHAPEPHEAARQDAELHETEREAPAPAGAQVVSD